MDADVRRLLKSVSRSMYLSLAVLPRGVRDAMGLGYLLCRAADTIADTRLVPPAERLQTLERYRAAFAGGPAAGASLAEDYAGRQASTAEVELLGRLPECVALWRRFPAEERRLLQEVVFGVVDGMRMDLEHFPGETEADIRALQSAGELDRYCAFIGGAPGLFWTDLCLLRIPRLKSADRARLRAWGERLGKGLQITNILRDAAKDLRLGRCYLPEPELKAAGLKPADLLDPASLGRLKPVLDRWIRWGMDHLAAGADYVQAMPGLRLRAAVAWPLLLALRTLAEVRRSAGLLEPGRAPKVARREVYGLIAASPVFLASDSLFRRRFLRLRGELEEALAA